ncbi:hypothetical protein MKX01_020492 [Papaver californicum]|nr:hypothetical protein MKX01_020492 [Papaver californicum]
MTSEPMDLSSDPPMKLVLSPDQLVYCSDALSHSRRYSRTLTVYYMNLITYSIKNADKMENCKEALQDVNLSKNRYRTVVPFDKNRVVLKSFEDSTTPASDYINVSSCESNPRIIATQGPVQHTCEDFWEMVIQYYCPLIVMLTQLVDGHQNSERYVSPLTTKWKRTTDTLLVLRRLEVTHRKSEEPPHYVIHVQYPEWPDFGVPYNTLPVREILKMIYHTPHDPGSIIVHCSAGIGRTGTFCTILNTVQRILVGNMTALDLGHTVSILRSQRMGMVETMEQFLFCYNAVADELEDLISHSKSIADSTKL